MCDDCDDGLIVKRSLKTVDVTGMDDLKEKVSDVKVFGDPGAWKLICKASSDQEGWMKSTKAMKIKGLGVMVQVTTQQDENVAEALEFIPGACLWTDENGVSEIRKIGLE